MRILRVIKLGLAFGASGSCALGQLATWEITGANAASNNPMPATLLGANINSASLTLGSGVSASSTTDFFSGSGFNNISLAAAITGGDYLSFSITPAAGHTLSFSSITFNSGVSSAVTNFNAALLSSMTGFNTSSVLHSYSFATTTPPTQSITLSGISALQNLGGAVEFRIYGWRDTSGTSTFRLRSLSGNDLTISGSTSAIPEPATYVALLGGAALAFVAIRRRRLERAA